MVSFPSLRTTAFYEHGMSGGPVIDEHGRVIGLVSSSYDKELSTAYAALLGGIAELSTDLEDLTGNLRPCSIKQPAEEGALNIDEGSVTVSRDESGLLLSWGDSV